MIAENGSHGYGVEERWWDGSEECMVMRCGVCD